MLITISIINYFLLFSTCLLVSVSCLVLIVLALTSCDWWGIITGVLVLAAALCCLFFLCSFCPILLLIPGSEYYSHIIWHNKAISLSIHTQCVEYMTFCVPQCNCKVYQGVDSPNQSYKGACCTHSTSIKCFVVLNYTYGRWNRFVVLLLGVRFLELDSYYSHPTL